MKSESVSCSSCLTLCDPMNCSLPGSSVQGILQGRKLEWVAIPFSRGSSQPRDWTCVSWIAGRFFTILAIRDAPLCVVIINVNKAREWPFPRSRQQLYLGSEKGLYLAYVSEYLGSWQCSISYLDWWLKGAYFYSNSIRCTFITYTFILSRLWDMVKDREAWCSAIHGVTKS